MRVLLRCDGGGALGVGHVMRSLALAEAAVAAGHEVVVAGHFEGSFLQRQLAAAPVEVVQLAVPMGGGDLQSVMDLVERADADVLHVDSYVLSDVVPSDVVISNVEDGAFGRRSADVVVDPTLGAELSPRPDDGSTFLLRGSRYTPIRQRVIDARRPAEIVDTVARSVLVVMGGTDPVGLAPGAVELLARTGMALHVTVIAVGENAELVRAAARGSRLSLDVMAPVDDLASVVARQDLVVTAAGTTVWELCCLGVPMAVVCAVDNQRAGYDRVVAAGAAIGLGGPEPAGDEDPVDRLNTALTDSRVRDVLTLAARKVVDGLGAWRVVRTWEQALRLGPLPEVADVGLVARQATLEDSRLLWEWRNDPGTRASSHNGELVSWTEHLAWLGSTLSRTDRILLVVQDAGSADAGSPVGTVRWDLAGELEWEVSITVAPDRRGRSLARPLLRAAEVALSQRARSSGTRVTAYLAGVHIDNAASLRLFESTGYLPDLPPDSRGFMRFRKPARVP